MFTGLVQQVGLVERVVQAGMTDVWVASAFEGLELGESIACDGCCLTVVEAKRGTFKVQASPETLRRTTLGSAARGERVHLEGDLIGKWVARLVRR